MSIQIAFIGAGSVGFTRKLVRDVLLVPELQDATFALHDISKANLDRVARIVRKDIRANRLPAKVTTSLNRKRALEGAHYVINCTRIGGLEAFALDIDIPLKYGIDQCVGDTLCAGGIFYGQRNIPQILAFAADARAVAADGCLFLNYANPMAMNTWAALDAFDRGEGVDTVGLCHGVQHSHWMIAEALGAADKSEIDYTAVGINHQTWFTRILWNGREIGGEELRAAFERHPTFRKTEKCRIDVLRRFGLWSTESNGHLSEYLPWYRKRPREIRRWISTDSSWIDGETGGYLRVCTEERDWFRTEFPKLLAEAGRPMAEWRRSEEHGSFIIEARETGRGYRGHFNVRNGGTIPALPADAIIEATGFVDRFGIHMAEGLDLPLACAATCQASVDVQRMAKEAAVHGDVTLLKQALLHDPLTAAVCDPEEVWQLADEMLVAQAKWLPQYGKAIAAAKRRLARGPIVRTGSARGAARLKTKSVSEMKRNAVGARRNAAAADKAAADRARAASRVAPGRAKKAKA